jgi:hypothetical protein
MEGKDKILMYRLHSLEHAADVFRRGGLSIDDGTIKDHIL